ncbi:MAG: hypothetical protein AAF490_19555 [Chloroflexota bacterium]
MRQRVLCCLILSIFLFQFFVTPTYAQSGCALQINEVMYHPTGSVGAEWVELYVAQAINTDTTFFITDQDGGAGSFFSKAFLIPAGTAQGSYIIINNDGNATNDGQTTMTGIYTTISFFIGNGGSAELNNDGDEIVLFRGGDVDGVPCDYVEFEGGNSGIPSGFSWDSSCVQPNSGASLSISIDPDGTDSNSGCDWATSGEHSPNNLDLPITGAPDSKGWSNNTTPTAVTLASFDVSNQSGVMNGLSVLGTAVFAFFYLKRRK